MEEFDIDLNNDIGTSVLQLQNKNQQYLENDFNYDNIVEQFNSESNINGFDYNNNRDNLINTMVDTIDNKNKYDINHKEHFTNTIIDVRPKKQNINNFVRNLENNLDNFNQHISTNLNEPLPVNLTKQMINNLNNKNNHIIEPMANIQEKIIPVQKKNITVQEEKVGLEKLLNIEYIEIIICIILFMLLNNKLIIESIYSIPLFQKINSPYPNLLLRAIIFGLLLFLIKKFNI